MSERGSDASRRRGAGRGPGEDPGVPGAVARALRRLDAEVGAAAVDRLWIFPPFRTGRRETGVVAAGCFGEGDRRTLVTLAYRAEETGRGVSFESRFEEEGEAPAERLPGIMEGVVRRLDESAGDPRTVELGGDAERFLVILHELEEDGLNDDFPRRPASDE
jgi:hypothetical protein